MRTCTKVSGTLRNSASRAAHWTAILEAGEPSTPTTIPGCVLGFDMLFSFGAIPDVIGNTTSGQDALVTEANGPNAPKGASRCRTPNPRPGTLGASSNPTGDQRQLRLRTYSLKTLPRGK